ncbi:hypothetical protein [Egicoccus halophilus]|uniref:Uncharacterized protein n=1 Tax=Egicoccus halophilus TaxID=1670830 RepID=A0A8J3EU64_9ACTN|nr:hypothetical protein [Egicoccus halophilus]GGI07035.1 hypothetical protein GCM10011354_22080 [Egicoccus halophilus]
MELSILASVVNAVLAWWRRPLTDTSTFQHPVGPHTVFCEFCSDWHPPDNCAGSWP